MSSLNGISTHGGGNGGEIPLKEECISRDQKAEHCNKDSTSFASSSDNSSAIDAVSDSIERVGISNDNDDDELFQDPPPKDDCQICFLPIPFSFGVSRIPEIFMPCCGKVICGGCVMVSRKEMNKGNLKEWCPFCRTPNHRSHQEIIKRLKKRMKLNEAAAFLDLGKAYKTGAFGLSKDMNKAFELYIQAAEHGSINAHYMLAVCFYDEGVKKDEKKAIQHYKIAAIGGHEAARHKLGVIEMSNGNVDRAIKHYIMAAKSGLDDALKKVGMGYKAGFVTKDDYAATLRAYKSTQDELKSKQRDEAIAIYNKRLNL